MPQKIRTAGDSGSLPQWLEEKFDSIDSSVFSSDSLHSREALDRFDYYLARWQRELGLQGREFAAVDHSAQNGQLALLNGQKAEIFGVLIEDESHGNYFVEVHPSKQEANKAWEAYQQGSTTPHGTMGYLACKSYTAPGYEGEKLLDIVNRDDFTPQFAVPKDNILNLPGMPDDTLHGVLVENRESQKIALIVFESKHQAAEFHFENCGRPASAAVAFVPNRCAVAFMVGDTVESLPTDIGGKAIIIFNLDDVEVVDGGEEKAPIEMRGMIAKVSL